MSSSQELKGGIKTNVKVTEEDKTTDKKFKRPPFDLWSDAKNALHYVLYDPQALFIVGPVLLLGESMLLKIITQLVSYTEIDYTAYMEQIDMINSGNYNYLEIRGGTGPLVYPAGHVWIYHLMHWVTSGLEDIRMGQVFFRYLYLLTMALQLEIYYILKLPPWCIALGCLSKRLHSIYVLRLFNDCFTTFYMVITVLIYLLHSKTKHTHLLAYAGSAVYSIAVSIKMNALLYFPGIIVANYILTDGLLLQSIGCLVVIGLLQGLIAWPFLKNYPSEYIKGAFDFQRQFFYKWSVNWQFLDESAFQDQLFQKMLLAGHLIMVTTVILIKYPHIISSGIKTMKHGLTSQTINRDHIPYVLIMSNFTGILFSRSLHYQFLSWYHWTIPIVISWSGFPIYMGIAWYIAHEWCWNSYPPNATASAVLISLNFIMLAACLYQKSKPKHKPIVYAKKNN